jgi:AraC-like DNA-binding protein
MQGQCYLRETSGDEVILLQTGDGVSFPTEGLHWIGGSPDSQNLPAENCVTVTDDKELALLKSDEVTAFSADSSYWRNNPLAAPSADNESSNDSHETILLSVTVSYNSTIDHPFLKNLPCFIYSSPKSSMQIQNVLTNLLIEESFGSYSGRDLMIDHLTEVLFVQLLRPHMREKKYSNDFLDAFFDPNIGVALSLIYTETDQKWTVEALARECAMGRTVFTQKFIDMVEDTPKSYVINTRMIKAKSRLQDTNDSIISIAKNDGYAHESSFGKAIKKRFNTTPSTIRKRL